MRLQQFDEMYSGPETLRPHYKAYAQWLADQPPEVMAARREEAADLERSTLLATLAHGAVLNGVHLALVVFIGHGCRYHFANIGDGRQVDHPLDVQVHRVVVLLSHRLAGDGFGLIGEGERGHTDQCKNQ